MITKPIDDARFTRLLEIAGGCDLNGGPWVAGGAARKLWYGEDWINGDVDVWFSSQSQFDRANQLLTEFVTQSALSEHHTTAAETFYHAPTQRKVPIHKTANAITFNLSLSRISTKDVAKIQLINKRWFPSLEDVFQYFDFTVCKFATDGKNLVTQQDAMLHCASRDLVLNRDRTQDIDDPYVLAKRTIKYGFYGFVAERRIMDCLISSRDENGCINPGELLSKDDDDGY